jgi:hypothetical protein
MTESAFTRSQKRRIVLIGAVFPTVVALVGAALILSWIPELPDPIASHWGPGGVDGTSGVWQPALLLVGVVVLFSAIATGAQLSEPARASASWRAAFVAATGVFLSATLGIGITGSVAAQRGLADAAAAPSPTLPLVIGALVGVVLGGFAFLLTPRPRTVATPDDETPVMHLEPAERAVWTARVAPGRAVVWIVALGVAVLVAVAVPVVLESPDVLWVLAVPLAVVVLSTLTLVWTVRVDSAGVVARSVLGVPRVVVPLDAITEAKVVDVNPVGEFGGWGLRWGSAGRFGVITRRGEALEIVRATGRSLVITVPDAATAAALVNGLRVRAHYPPTKQ